jgi:hypothetical protein
MTNGVQFAVEIVVTRRRSSLAFLRVACLVLLAIFVVSVGSSPAKAQDEDAPGPARVVGPLTVGVYLEVAREICTAG